MKKIIPVFYRYQPIRKLYSSALIGIGQKLIGCSLLKGILDSYTEKKVDRFHEMPTKANYTLHNNGALTISRNVTVLERSKSEAPDGKKKFECSGYYESLWIPLKKESMKIEDWRILSQNVYVLTNYSHGGNKDN